MASADSTEHVVLVPGFFGFTHLGELPYFAHVESVLKQAAQARSRAVEVSVVSTDPTASLPYRAARVAEHLNRLSATGAERFHIIGHSTGGLDARLLVTPAVRLPTTVDIEANAAKVKSVVCVASPHRGTPLASVFGGRIGQSLLQLFSLTSIAILRRGRVPVVALMKLAAMLERVRAGRRPNASAVARLHDQLLSDFSPERQAQLETFLTQVKADQGLLPQLTPEGLEVFNASTPDRAGVRYGCAVAWGRPPGVGTAMKAGLDPYAQATHALYTAVYRLCKGMPARRREQRSPGQDGMLGAAYGVVPTWDASDGMVPTRSQVWGELLHAAVADHLDLVGFFSDPHGDPPHYDWLASASGFDRRRFEAMWNDIAHFVLDERVPVVATRSGSGLLMPGQVIDTDRGTPLPVDWPIDDASDVVLGDDPAPRPRGASIAAWGAAVTAGVAVFVVFGALIAAIGVAVIILAVGLSIARRRRHVPRLSPPSGDDPAER